MTTAQSAAPTESEMVDRARLAEASALVAVLLRAGATAQVAAGFGDEEIGFCARLAGVRFPSHTSWTLALGLLALEDARQTPTLTVVPARHPGVGDRVSVHFAAGFADVDTAEGTVISVEQDGSFDMVADGQPVVAGFTVHADYLAAGTVTVERIVRADRG